MSLLLPPGVTEASFVDAFTEFQAIVGDQWASSDQDDREQYNDPYNPGDPLEFVAGGFVAPNNVGEVQEVVRIANRHKIPLWPISTGKNLAVGGAAPLVPGTVTLDLKRMNRILEVNEELAYAVVEPGVSFFDMYRHLQENDYELWMSVPGPGWGSFIGNGLERGAGYGYLGDHFATSCGMEVVLPDGELLRTGMGAMGNNPSWHVSNYGFGPMVDGIFTQSNYGIVTRMGRYLLPAPESYMGCEINCAFDSGLEPLIEALRPFKLDDTIPNPLVISNAAIIASFMSARNQWYDGEGPIPEEILNQMQEQLGLGRWNSAFGLYGPETRVRGDWDRIKAAVSDIPGIELHERFYLKGDEIHHPRDMSMAGIPNLTEFGLVNWRGPGGHIDFSPVGPLTARHARIAHDLIKERVEDYGFDFLGGLYCEKRFFRLICTLVFNKDDPDEMQRTRELFTDLIQTLADHGYGEYRTHLAYMEQVANTFDFNERAMLRFQQKLKDAIDPNGILAPGKSGVWPGADPGVDTGGEA